VHSSGAVQEPGAGAGLRLHERAGAAEAAGLAVAAAVAVACAWARGVWEVVEAEWARVACGLARARDAKGAPEGQDCPSVRASTSSGRAAEVLFS
jgi:hypothetical protein